MINFGTVHVSCDTFGTHSHQIFCGLNLLEQSGVVRVKYVAPPAWLRSRRTRQAVYLRFERDDASSSHFYDLNDSSSLAHENALEHCDYYHKRSYVPEHYTSLPLGHKVKPFGMNYQIMVNSTRDFVMRVVGDFLFNPYNPLSKKQRHHVDCMLKYARDAILGNKNKEILRHGQLSNYPMNGRKNIITFQCRLWDPKHYPDRHRDSISQLNEARIEAVHALKKSFGSRFIGGLQSNDVAQRMAKSLIVTGNTDRKSYLSLIKQAAVVVTTNGISDSIGWKMGEFVANAKAIVCEPLIHSLPGGFRPGANYLDYSSVEECLIHCELLLENAELNREMSEHNFAYYNRYLRPDMIVYNSLFPNDTFNSIGRC